jgi:hypothetical protein
MNNTINFLKCLKQNIHKFINNTPNNVVRVKKTSIRDALLYKLLLTQKTASGQSVTNNINYFKKYDTLKSSISRVSLIEREQQIPVSYYKELYNSIHTIIKTKYVNNNKPQIIGVDGTYNNSYYSFGTGMMANKCLSIGFFNCTLNMPVNLQISPKKSEKCAIKNNINLLGSNSIVVLDKGYISYQLFDQLHECKLKFVCRITEPVYLNKKSNMYRYVEYKINNNNYYLITNLINEKKYTTNALADIYHSRWKIEEYYKFIKSSITYDTIRQKQLDSIIKTTYAVLIVSQLTYLFAHIFSKNNKIVNKTSLTKGIYEHFLLKIIYENKFSKSYIRSFINIYINLINTTLNVSRPRICKNTNCKWYQKSFQKGNYKK